MANDLEPDPPPGLSSWWQDIGRYTPPPAATQWSGPQPPIFPSDWPAILARYFPAPTPSFAAPISPESFSDPSRQGLDLFGSGSSFPSANSLGPTPQGPIFPSDWPAILARYLPSSNASFAPVNSTSPDSPVAAGSDSVGSDVRTASVAVADAGLPQPPIFPSDWPAILARYFPQSTPSFASLFPAGLPQPSAASPRPRFATGLHPTVPLSVTPSTLRQPDVPPGTFVAGRPLNLPPGSSVRKIGPDQVGNGASGGLVNTPPSISRPSDQTAFNPDRKLRLNENINGVSGGIVEVPGPPRDPPSPADNLIGNTGFTLGDLLNIAAVTPIGWEGGLAKGAATLETIGPRLFGSFEAPADLNFGTTLFGNFAHQRAAEILQRMYPEAGFVFHTLPGEKGIDVTVMHPDWIKQLGFRYAEIKPLSASGERTLMRQIERWGYDPAQVRPITYDANGNLYYGFR